MINLILKDFVVLKKYIFWSAVYSLFIIFAFNNMKNGVPSALIAGIVGPAYILCTYACAFDDKNKSEIMINSLPIHRNDIVLSRYLSFFMYSIIFAFVYLVNSTLINMMALPIKAAPMPFGGFAVALFASAVYHGIYLPIYFRVGYMKSKIANFILFFVAFFFIGMIGDLLKDLQDVHFILTVKRVLSNFSQGETISAIFVLVFIIMGVSYVLSSKFYSVREF